MPDTLNSILEELRSKITIQGLSNHDIALAHQKIEELMLSEEEIRRIIIDEELMPKVCADSGQAEWTVGESRKLAQVIHNSMLKKLKEGE